MTVYDIRIVGHLDARWLRRFGGLSIAALPEGETRISGPMDQAALHGVLNRIRDLGLELVSVQRQPSSEEAPPSAPDPREPSGH